MKLTTNYGLKKPDASDIVNIDDFNYNADAIDSAIKEVKTKVDSLNLTASNVKMSDGSTVEDTVSANKTSILNNTELANQALEKANEAFQCGDNVKTQLVDKLISEGLDVSTNNTFEELIGGISLGKRWATGTYDNKEIKSVNGAWLSHSIPFIPSFIFIECEYMGDTRNQFNGFTTSKVFISNLNNPTTFKASPNLSHELTHEVNISGLSSTKVYIEMIRTTGNYNSNIGIRLNKWYAFE